MREKIKIEIDLLRDSLRNIFVVMFGIMSGEITIFYRLVKNVNYLDFFVFVIGIITIWVLGKIKSEKNRKINDLLRKLEE